MRRSRSRLLLLVPLLGLAVLVAITSGALYLFERSNLAATGDDLQRAQERLVAAENELDLFRGDLDAAAEEIEGLEGELASASESLTERTEERDELRSDLDAAEVEIDGLAGSLDAAQGSLQDQQQRTSLQAGQIAVLKECLGGMAVALDYAAYELWTSAAAALEAVQSSCNQASAYF